MATCQTNNQMRYMRRTMPDTSCPCHETVPMNGCPNTRDFFPANMPIAMAYVPWQKWQNIYEPVSYTHLPLSGISLYCFT